MKNNINKDYLTINPLIQNLSTSPFGVDLGEFKRIYSAPLVERIELDNEISLTLDSTPNGPGETNNSTPKYLNSDPFKTNVC